MKTMYNVQLLHQRQGHLKINTASDVVNKK